LVWFKYCSFFSTHLFSISIKILDYLILDTSNFFYFENFCLFKKRFVDGEHLLHCDI